MARINIQVDLDRSRLKLVQSEFCCALGQRQSLKVNDGLVDESTEGVTSGMFADNSRIAVPEDFESI